MHDKPRQKVFLGMVNVFGSLVGSYFIESSEIGLVFFSFFAYVPLCDSHGRKHDPWLPRHRIEREKCYKMRGDSWGNSIWKYVFGGSECEFLPFLHSAL